MYPCTSLINTLIALLFCLFAFFTRYRGHIYLIPHCVPVGNISEDEHSLNSLPHSHYVSSCEDCFFSNAIHLVPDTHLDQAPSFCSAHYALVSIQRHVPNLHLHLQSHILTQLRRVLQKPCPSMTCAGTGVCIHCADHTLAVVLFV